MRKTLSSFLLLLFLAGILQGQTSQAFKYVKADTAKTVS